VNLDCAIPRLARAALAAALAMAAGVAASQTAARPEPVKADPKADARAEAKGDAKADAESAAAMERARRLADNPMRLILEASRSRARGVVVAPAVEATDAGSLRRTAVAGEVPATTAAPLPGAAAPAAAPAPVAPAPLPQLRSELAVAPAGSAVATAPVQLSTTGLPAATVAPGLTSLGNVPAPARLEASVAPQLLRMVEPEIPQRVLDQVGGQREVTVEFVVRADGTTADINLLPPAPRALQRFVADALAQWRYAPLSEPRRMRVQLVFNGG
jgi:hypothetical protein